MTSFLDFQAKCKIVFEASACCDGRDSGRRTSCPSRLMITCLALESQPLNCHLRTRYTVSWRTADQEVLCGHNRDHKPIILHTPDLSISDCHFVERQKREVHCLHENVNVADNQGKKEHSRDAHPSDQIYVVVVFFFVVFKNRFNRDVVIV